MEIIYLLIFFFIMLSSSIAGLGGGVVLKPLLDFIGVYTSMEIAIISSLAILVMSFVSLFMKIRQKDEKLNMKLLLTITISSVIGASISSFALASITDENFIIITQSVLLVFLIIILLLMTNFMKKTYEIKSLPIIFIVGIFLGLFPSFIGIGGGLINVPIFTRFFKINYKKAVFYSLALVSFSQITKLFVLSRSIDFSSLNYYLLPEIIIASVAGGIVGSLVIKKFGEKAIKTFYNVIIVFVLALTVYNLIG